MIAPSMDDRAKARPGRLSTSKRVAIVKAKSMASATTNFPPEPLRFEGKLMDPAIEAGCCEDERAVVEIVRAAEEAAVPLTVTAEGEKLQLAPVGNPAVHVRLTLPLNPFRPVTSSV